MIKFIVKRIFEDGKRRIYQRCWKEPGLKKYFEYEIETEQSTGKEFISSSQVVSYLKKVGSI